MVSSTRSERFVAWITRDNDEIGQTFQRAGRHENALDVSGLTVIQLAYSKAIYGHLRSLTEGFRKAAKTVRLVEGDNGLEVHAAQLEHIITFGSRNMAKQLGGVPTVLHQF